MSCDVELKTVRTGGEVEIKEIKKLLILVAVFIGAYFLPIEKERFIGGIFESMHLLRYYAREHTILCLIPALFIAGAVSVFISQGAVIKYLGGEAKKSIAYLVASVSGTILAVCSCTILPLFSGIYKRGAGLGPAVAFLYSGPAINILAIAMTARILGLKMGVARAVGAVLFGIVIGLIMQFIFRKEDKERLQGFASLLAEDKERPVWQNILYFGLLVLILIVINWGEPRDGTTTGFVTFMFTHKWILTSILSTGLGIVLWKFFGLKFWKLLVSMVVVVFAALISPANNLIPFVAGIGILSIFLASENDELKEWLGSTWDFAKLIVPLLFIGVVIAGALLGRPNNEGWIPSIWIESLVGGNSLGANFFASISGAFMYFATLTEVPILQGLMGSGMGNGPALALLLSGPALSLPSMLVINSVLGPKKTGVYIGLVIIMSTITGMFFGTFF